MYLFDVNVDIFMAMVGFATRTFPQILVELLMSLRVHIMIYN